MRIRGVELAYRDTGIGDIPLVWCHGFASSMRSEGDALIDFQVLARQGRVVRWDARGHGQSEGGGDSDDYRWDRFGRDLVELCDGLGLTKWIAGGLSMGAAVALHAAVAAPERVAGLVLVTPPTAFEGLTDQSRRYLDDADLVDGRGLEAFVDRANSGGPPPILAPIAGGFHWTPDVEEVWLPDVLRGAAASNLPSRAQLLRLSPPTLILTWPEDPEHPIDVAEELQQLIPNSQLSLANELGDVGGWTADIADFCARQRIG